MQFDEQRRRELAQAGKAALDRRDEALEYLAAARAAGNRKEARAWESAVRSCDKLIADYGLDRYATRT